MRNFVTNRCLNIIADDQVLPSIVSYGAAISSCENCWQWEQALCLFEEMYGMDITANLVCYNAIISCCEKASEWQKSLQLLQQMSGFVPGRSLKVGEVQHLTPDVITYNGVISSCEKASEWQLALCLLIQMTVATIRRSIITYSATVSACEKGHLAFEMGLQQKFWIVLIHFKRDLFANVLVSTKYQFFTAFTYLPGVESQRNE